MRIEPSGTGLLDEVAGILREALVGVLARLRLHLLAAAQLANGGSELFLRDAGILEDLGCRAACAYECEQHQLDGDELVALLGGQLLGTGEDIVSLAAEVGLAPLHSRQALQLGFESLADGLLVDRQLTEQELCHLLARLHDGGEQVLRLDGLLAAGLGGAHGLLYGLLRFDGKLVECHSDMLFRF